MKLRLAAFVLLGMALSATAPAADLSIGHEDSQGAVKLVLGKSIADIYVDANDFKLVKIAADLLADDIERVTDRKPPVVNDPEKLGADAVIVGAVGHSELIDRLIAQKKIDAADVRGQWETFTLQIVEHPAKNIERALVIFGSDRRGTAYGVFSLSEAIGVSPWYWWADVTPLHHDALVVKAASLKEGPPSVKYRGIFINDEDWGLERWAAKTFDPELGNIGPKTYQKVFELLLRLKGNYLWPAMHLSSTEFGRIPANLTLADDWGIVMGASHTEAMNRNNVLWPKEGVGPWRYDTNRENMLAYWEEWAKKRGPYEAVWTLALRGVHDSAMLGPNDPDEKKKIVEQAIGDQRELLRKYVNPDLTKVPQLFAPYKEVLSLYQRGMKVPDDVTLLWCDDNFGYIRQLSTPQEQLRSGGSGIYYHISYLGGPRSYVWLNTTPPALIWEEMTKAYAYGANRIWVLNVGDIKPGEIGIEFWSRLGWNINAYDRRSVANFLRDWATREFGPEHALAIAAVMNKYYRLGFARKPEAMDSNSFDDAERKQRLAEYDALVNQSEEIYSQMPPNRRDAFYELVLYPVKACALVNHVFIGSDRAAALEQLNQETAEYNNTLAGGKWRHMMLLKGTALSQFAFKWPADLDSPATTQPADSAAEAVIPELSVFAEHFSRNIARQGCKWLSIAGLGRQANSMAVLPVNTPSIEQPDQLDSQSPELDYEFSGEKTGPVDVTVYAIPTHRINATHGLRYAVAIDDEPPQIVNLEQAAGDRNRQWERNVIHNASVTSSHHNLTGAGQHTLKLFMVDPGVVLEKFVVSSQPLPNSEFGPPETVNHP